MKTLAEIPQHAVMGKGASLYEVNVRPHRRTGLIST